MPRKNVEEAKLYERNAKRKARADPIKAAIMRGINRKSQRKAYQTAEGRVVYLVQRARARALKRGISFDLDEAWVLDRWQEQGGKCKLTGFVFDLTTDPDGGSRGQIRAHSPSLDRIDPSLGYTKDNVRLICSHMNFALGAYGQKAFEELIEAYRANH